MRGGEGGLRETKKDRNKDTVADELTRETLQARQTDRETDRQTETKREKGWWEKGERARKRQTRHNELP